MKPEIFMNNFERTSYGDSIYSSIGRALTIATRFETNCKMLAVILQLKEKKLFEDEEEFNRFINALYKKRLFEDIEIIENNTEDYNGILHKARASRNEMAHELTKGLDTILELLPKDEIKRMDSRMIELIENISAGDIIISYLLSVVTNETIPNIKFLKAYRNEILQWVMDRTD